MIYANNTPSAFLCFDLFGQIGIRKHLPLTFLH